MVPWAETYSVFSLYILRALQGNLLIAIINSVITIISLCFWNKFGDIYMSESLRDCNKDND